MTRMIGVLSLALALLAAAGAACGGSDEYTISGISGAGPIEPNKAGAIVVQVETGSVCTLTRGPIDRTDTDDPERTLPAESPNNAGEIRFRVGVPLEAVPQTVAITVTCNKNNKTATAQTTLQIGPRTTPTQTATPSATP